VTEAEVLIVGGGPGGSACAWRLRQLGVSDVLILDREAFPRTKLCAGWITPQVVSDLAIEPGEYPHGWLRFERVRVHRGWLGLAQRTLQYSIRRFEFDAWLVERSRARVLRHYVKEVRRDGDGFAIDGAFRARWLVGAGGTRCPVHRALFRDASPRARPLQAVTLEQEFPCDWSDPDCHLWFLEKGLPGYAWYVPKANGYLNVGVGGIAARLEQRSDHIRRHWDHLVATLERRGLVPRRHWDPGGYSYYVRAPAAAGAPRSGNAFLVGDSAGLATRDLCEGIGPAVYSGLRAAESIAKGAEYDLRGAPEYSTGGGWLSRRLERAFLGTEQTQVSRDT
jgi:flavin-dependent dehydrogenase